MSIQRHTDGQNSLTTFTVIGTLTIPEIAEVIKTFKSEPPAKNIIWDFSKANVGDAFDVNAFEKIAALAKANLGLRSGSKTAFVATTDLFFGLARMYTTYLEFQKIAHEVQVFRTIEMARQWLSGEAD